MLYPTDKAGLSNGDWLTDNVIDAGMKLLQKDHPHIGGLESTCTQQFDAQRGDFVQILNISRSHWVTITNIGCKQEGHVLLYNSLKSYSLCSKSKKYISMILNTPTKLIQVISPNVQQQYGSSDCGLFALAFAQSLCAGDNPEEITYTQHKLRPHLLQCLETGTITNFPPGSRRRKTKVFQSRLPKMTNISVYCSCRETSEGKMVQCNKCHEWFHDRCIPPTREEVWTNNSLSGTVDNA